MKRLGGITIMICSALLSIMIGNAFGDSIMLSGSQTTSTDFTCPHNGTTVKISYKTDTDLAGQFCSYDDNFLLILDPSKINEDRDFMLTIPRIILDSKLPDCGEDMEFLVLVDGAETLVDEEKSNKYRTFHIPIQKDTQRVELVGTFVPEHPGDWKQCIKDVISDFSPKEQSIYNIPNDKITCKKGLELILKYVDGSPACVTTETKQKLIEREWAKPV